MCRECTLSSRRAVNLLLVNILLLLLLLLLHGAVQVLSQQQELLQGSHLLLLFSVPLKSDAARPIWMLWLKQKTAVDRG